MNFVVVEDAQFKPSDVSTHFSVRGMIVLAEPPRGEQGLQEIVQVLFSFEGVSIDKQ